MPGTTAAVAAPTTGIPLEHYRQIVTEYDSVVSSGGRISPDTARGFAGKFSRATDIRRPTFDGKPADDLVIANPAEVTVMRRIAGTPGGAEVDSDTSARARILRTLLSPAGPTVVVPNPDRTLRSILAREEFQYAAPTSLARISPPDTSFFDRIGSSINNAAERVSRAIERFFRWIGGGGTFDGPGAPPMVGLSAFVRFFGFLILVVAVAAGVAWLLIRWYQNGGRLRFNRRATPTATGLELGPDEIVDPLGTARRLADFGDYRGAVRLVYIASLRRLAGAGLLVLEPNRTNWEYQGQLRGRSASVNLAMLAATELFDRIWYGSGRAGAEDFEQMTAIHGALPQSPNEGASGTLSSREAAASAAESDR